jgi:hypothetical protein
MLLLKQNGAGNFCVSKSVSMRRRASYTLKKYLKDKSLTDLHRKEAVAKARSQNESFKITEHQQNCEQFLEFWLDEVYPKRVLIYGYK